MEDKILYRIYGLFMAVVSIILALFILAGGMSPEYVKAGDDPETHPDTVVVEIADADGNITSLTTHVAPDDGEQIYFMFIRNDDGTLTALPSYTDPALLRWKYVAVISNSFTFSGTTAKMSSTVTRYSGNYSMVVSQTLQQYKNSKYNQVAKYSKTTSSVSTTMSNSKAVTRGYTYRMVSTVVIKNSSGSTLETITLYYTKTLS